MALEDLSVMALWRSPTRSVRCQLNKPETNWQPSTRVFVLVSYMKTFNPCTVSCPQECMACRGVILFTGVGKSGFIAQKISQTLVSTGTKAMFLNPTDALHGDIGIVGPADLLVALSKSGTSEELLKLMPYARVRRSSYPFTCPALACLDPVSQSSRPTSSCTSAHPSAACAHRPQQALSNCWLNFKLPRLPLNPTLGQSVGDPVFRAKVPTRRELAAQAKGARLVAVTSSRGCKLAACCDVAVHLPLEVLPVLHHCHGMTVMSAKTPPLQDRARASAGLWLLD